MYVRAMGMSKISFVLVALLTEMERGHINMVEATYANNNQTERQ